MAEPRPYVINGNSLKILLSAPVTDMRPSLGSLVQRQTIDIGCYPFPFMVNEENIPLDGRTVVVNGESVRLETRTVPGWCSENAYAKYPGDPTYNNGKIVWVGNRGFIKSNISTNDTTVERFTFNPAVGVSYPNSGLYNTAFIGMDGTVPVEWRTIRDIAYGPGGFDNGVSFSFGETYNIANNVLFKAWAGLTYEDITVPSTVGGPTFAIRPLLEYNLLGGTFSPFFDRYNYGCLEQIFNSERFAVIGINPNEFWEGTGVSFGASGGLSGALFFLNALTGGDNAGSYFVFKEPDFPYSELTKGATTGTTLSGKQLALNLYSFGTENPFLGPGDPVGGFVDTMALLLGTSQKIANLTGGATASLRALDFNNPCSASWVYRDDTELGRWGYQVTKIPIGEDLFDPGPPPEIGCNVNDFIDYIKGTTGINNGIVHPLSWMFWKGISSGGAVSEYRLGYMHDYIGEDEVGTPLYTQLEGIHDYLCYEYQDPDGIVTRQYYPIRPITSQWYNSQVRPRYNSLLQNGVEARDLGGTLDKKYDTGFPLSFRDTESTSSFNDISLRVLDEGIPGQEDAFGVTIDFPEATSLNGVTGVMFPYLIPIASNAMQGIGPGNGDVQIGGEFGKFAEWLKQKFNVTQGDISSLYQYYADGVSSAADFTQSTTAPFTSQQGTPPVPDFRLFSWNLLSKIRARNLLDLAKEVKSSFQLSSDNRDFYGAANYRSPTTIRLDGSQLEIQPEKFPPYALPSGFGQGLTYPRLEGESTVVVPLDCGSFVNVVRYANVVSPIDGGLTASRELIADVALGGDLKSLAEVEALNGGAVGEIDNNITNNFRRNGGPNISQNFYTNDATNGSNFFFTTNSDDPTRGVFSHRYYLTAAEYLEKYGENGGQQTNKTWWENVDIRNLMIETGYFDPDTETEEQGKLDLSGAIAQPLVLGGNWSDPQQTSDFGFRNGSYVSAEDIIPGILAALNDRVHPAFIFRILTTSIFQDLAIEDTCLANWRSGGVPCHELQSVKNALRDPNRIYGSYFSGDVQCGNVGIEFDKDQFEANKGKDIFGRCMIRVIPGQLGGAIYAYNQPYFSPFPKDVTTNPYFKYQNQNCAGAAGISDPPTNAALSSFGIQFAEVLKIVEEKTTDLNDRVAVRDELFAYTGNTASGTIDGSDNNVGATGVAQWLNGKLESILSYYNRNRNQQTAEIEQVDAMLSALYGQRFDTYKSELANLSQYRLWAVKPACVEEWTPQCAELAQLLSNSTDFRRAAFAPSSVLFRDQDYNSDIPQDLRTNRITVAQTSVPSGANTTILTSNDIVPQNEGFLGAFRTVYVEPLGLAENVLASEAQAVPRATISSTVLGKISTIIDSSGFLRDVNVVTFESGYGTKILGDNTTGSITISVEGLTLGSLEDVGITGATSGDILIFDGESGRWINRPFADVLQPFLVGFTGGVDGTNFFYQDSAPDAGITIGSRWMNSNTGIEYIYISDGDSFQWIQSSVDVTAETPTFTYNTTLVTGSEYAAVDTDYYIGVSYAGPVLIQLPSEPDEGKTVIVKDASGFASYENRKITVVGASISDTIDNEASAIINVNNGALQFIYKNGWRII